jgi:hypothetical protein
MSAQCENCEAEAVAADEAGTPLCAACYSKTAAECAYGDGFSDALNDAAPDLIAAAQAVVNSPNADTFARLRHALSQVDLERAA